MKKKIHFFTNVANVAVSIYTVHQHHGKVKMTEQAIQGFIPIYRV